MPRSKQRTWKVESELGTVTAKACLPEGYDPETHPTIVFGHGAGADQDHSFMCDMREGLAREGCGAVTFNFHYKEAGRNAPDRAPKLMATFRAAIESAKAKLGVDQVFLGGKSLGGRMASMIAAEGDGCRGLVFFGYPLHPPKQMEKARVAHLPDITVPMLFLAGTRDALSDPELLKKTVKGLGKKAAIHWIEDGDHSFGVLKRTGKTEAEVRAELCQVAADWMKSTEAG
ncbi:MAG: dienelactone hydrolase family protein [Planctomycetota bacterium]